MEMEDQKGMVETIVKFTWTINNFLAQRYQDIHSESETFFVGSHPRIDFSPDDDEDDVVQICLHAGNSNTNWNQYASLKLSLINQADDKMTKTSITNIFIQI
ncbi:hypothetical protein HN51_048989 [Arachis hypogaea]